MKTNLAASSSFANANIGWMFYRYYYHGLMDKAWGITDDELREELFHKTWQRYADKNDEIIYGYNDFFITLTFDSHKQTLGRMEDRFYYSPQNNAQLVTTYPGLITGIGTEHETGELGEFKLGFAFDHSTGTPYIPASGIKGLLRNAFTKYPDLILNALSKKTGDINLQKLVEEIFDGKRDGTNIGVYQRDIFFDAYIVESNHTDNLFMGNDYITHHPSPFADPNPLQFLKVLPNVTFNFNFDLKDGSQINASEKQTLFKKILTTIGIGAKTNVGYGQLDYTHGEKAWMIAEEEAKKKIERQEKESTAKKTLIAGTVYVAKVISCDNGKLKIIITDLDIELDKKIKMNFEKGKILNIKVTGLNPIIFTIL